jgi:hypothetical protein
MRYKGSVPSPGTNPNSHIKAAMKCHRDAFPQAIERRRRAGLARKVAATINESQDASKQADGGDEKKQNAVAESFAAGSGGCGRGLVAHRAALGGGAGRGESECRDARGRFRHPPGTPTFKTSPHLTGFPLPDHLSSSKNRISRTQRPLIACQYTEMASAAVARDSRRSGRKATAAIAAVPPSTCNACAAVNT